MKINIEPVRKKETANVIDFEHEIGDAEKGAYAALLGAERIVYVRISGAVLQKNGFAAMDYEISAAFDAECARCNKQAAQELKIEGEKYLADKSEEKDENEDYYTLENPSMIDLGEFMAEFLSLDAPLRYLCGEDCKGLCQACGADLNAGACECVKQKNPAFKILDDFFEKE